jgi:DNA-binding response OmpR family regulator
MEFRILGPLEVSDGGAALSLGGPRHRKLLAVLLTHANEVISTERLIHALWGNKSCTARKVIAADQTAYRYSLMSPLRTRVRNNVRTLASSARSGCW